MSSKKPEEKKVRGIEDFSVYELVQKAGELGLEIQFKMTTKAPILVNVRWNDGYLETFKCEEVRQGADLLWMRLTNGRNRSIPLKQVRWFSTDPESHEKVR